MNKKKYKKNELKNDWWSHLRHYCIPFSFRILCCECHWNAMTYSYKCICIIASTRNWVLSYFCCCLNRMIFYSLIRKLLLWFHKKSVKCNHLVDNVITKLEIIISKVKKKEFSHSYESYLQSYSNCKFKNKYEKKKTFSILFCCSVKKKK